MTCKHTPGDPKCGGHSKWLARQFMDYEIIDTFVCDPHIVLKIKYPKHQQCCHDGLKVLVFANVTIIDVLKWKKIDPHFRGPTESKKEAPSPIARFPGTDEGWQDALDFIEIKV